MPLSEKKLAANRRNAKKSTGPKTAQGKIASSQNALKHGLYCGNVIVNSQYLKENQADYDALTASLIAELRPDGVLQNLLVRKIANCFWRYRRVINAETAQINRQLNDFDSNLFLANTVQQLMGSQSDSPALSDNKQKTKDDNDDSTDNTDDLANRIDIRSIPEDFYSRLMLRYEMRFDRQLGRSFRLLAQLKRESQSQKENGSDYGVPENEETNPSRSTRQNRS